MKSFFLTAMVPLLILVPVYNAYAHKVNIFAYAEDGTIHTQSYFADGGPAAGSKVTATGPDGEVIAEGTADDEGAYAFGITGPGPITVRLNASEGHGNEYTLTAEEIAAATGKPAPVSTTETAAETSPSPAPETAPATSPGAYVSTDEETVRRIVREELDKKLTPVNRQLMDIKEEFEKPGLSETLSGIGYILGILGIILIMRSRKK